MSLNKKYETNPNQTDHKYLDKKKVSINNLYIKGLIF